MILMKAVILIFIIIVVIAVFFSRTGDEDLWPPPPLITNVYTMTPQYRGSTPSAVAQMWWQPVSYIRNPYYP
jgi:hypothetical protein